jgi:hypothetical protein
VYFCVVDDVDWRCWSAGIVGAPVSLALRARICIVLAAAEGSSSTQIAAPSTKIAAPDDHTPATLGKAAQRCLDHGCIRYLARAARWPSPRGDDEVEEIIVATL